VPSLPCDIISKHPQEPYTRLGYGMLGEFRLCYVRLGYVSLGYVMFKGIRRGGGCPPPLTGRARPLLASATNVTAAAGSGRIRVFRPALKEISCFFSFNFLKIVSTQRRNGYLQILWIKT